MATLVGSGRCRSGHDAGKVYLCTPDLELLGVSFCPCFPLRGRLCYLPMVCVTLSAKLTPLWYTSTFFS